jgi:hypothetical protein
MIRPGNGYETARQMARFGVKVSAVMLVPGLLGLVRYLARSGK